MIGLLLTGLLLAALLTPIFVLKGLRAVEQADRERELKRQQEERFEISTTGQVVCIPPPTPPESKSFPDGSAWGGIDLPSDHFPGNGPGHGGAH